MLEHFVGCYGLGSSHQTPSLLEHLDSRLIGMNFQGFVSPDSRFLLHASRLEKKISAERSRVVALAGYAVFEEGGPVTEREKFLTMNYPEFRDTLNDANGTFALAAYDNIGGLILSTDSLGARPLYYAANLGHFYFSTSFELLVNICPAEHEMDLQAFAEQIAFGYPLGGRTLSSEISVLRDGECLVASEGQYRVERYHDWRKLPVNVRDREHELNSCANAFCQAVRSRIVPNEPQLSLLSGGLDSRMIVARLREEGVPVTASNCSMAGTLDHQLCEDFAEKAKVTVLHVPWTPDLLGVSIAKTTSLMLRRALSNLPAGPVFSGDGGGELFGFLMLSKKLLTIVKTLGVEEAIAYYASQEKISKQVVDSKFAEKMERLAFAGMSSELEELYTPSPEKSMQLFFILNDLRCHLHEYFSSLDSGARELILPFYDRRVLKSVMQISPGFDDYVGHQFYYDLMPRITPLTQSVAWQAYPESLPCPVESLRDGITQWNAVKQISNVRRAYWRRKTIFSVIRSTPMGIVRYWRIFLTVLLDTFPSEDRSYIFLQYLNLQESFASLNRNRLN